VIRTVVLLATNSARTSRAIPSSSRRCSRKPQPCRAAERYPSIGLEFSSSTPAAGPNDRGAVGGFAYREPSPAIELVERGYQF